MNPKLYIDPNGIVKYIEDCPVEPDWYAHKYWIHDPIKPISIPGAYEKDIEVYKAALSKAKQEAVTFAYQNDGVMDKYIPNRKPDTLYSLPSGIEIEVRTKWYRDANSDQEADVDFAYIKSSPQKDDDDFQKYLDGWINLCHKTIEAEEDDLKIIKAGNTLATLELVKLKYNSLSERFTITRKS